MLRDHPDVARIYSGTYTNDQDRFLCKGSFLFTNMGLVGEIAGVSAAADLVGIWIGYEV
jgi:hypothetical protein